MQIILEPGGKVIAEQGYLVGLMSVLDAILDMELEAIAKEFSLGAELSGALLSFDGMMGNSLHLIKAVEEDNWQLAKKLLETIRPASNIELVYTAMLDARQYADELLATIIEQD